MTNIHDPLMVVVPCLSAGPCGLVSGLFQSVQLTTTNLNTNPRYDPAHDDDDVSSLFGARPRCWWWSSHPWDEAWVCGLEITGAHQHQRHQDAAGEPGTRLQHCLDTSPTVTWHHRVILMGYYGSSWKIETLNGITRVQDQRWSSPAFLLGLRIQFVWRQPGEEC